MSRSNTRNLITRLFVFVVTVALVGADLIVLAQNTNSSTTMQDNTSMQGGNMSGANMNRSGRRRRRGRRRGRRSSSGMGMSNANAACGPENTNMAGGMQENANTGEATGGMSTGGGRRRRRGRRRSIMGFPAGQTSTDLQNAELERTTGRPEDLSGTYSGNITVMGGHEMSGPATITIKDNEITIEGQGMTHTGRISAVTTRGYTGATMYFPDVPDSATNTPLGISVRARHSGNSLTLTPLAGVRNGISFTSGGGGMGGGRRGRRGRRRSSSSGMTGNMGDTTAPSDTSGNMNSATPSDATDTMNANTSGGNMGGGRRKRGGRRRGNMNGNANGNMSGNMNTMP